MSPKLDLSWSNFCSTVFVQGEQRVHRISSEPRIEVFGDGVNDRIGLCIEVPSDVAIPPELSHLESIAIRTFDEDGRLFIEVATAAAPLHRQFFYFATAVAERITAEGRPAVDAIALELQCIAALLRKEPLLSAEREIGLLGELLFLKRLVQNGAGTGLDSWLGPGGEPHDFRVGSTEFEVKTTLRPHRVHTINGLEQLAASQSCTLYVVSVLLGPAGADAGFSLAETISELYQQFDMASRRVAQFEAALAACNLNKADYDKYARRYTMRRPLAVVRIDAQFPAITRPIIQGALGSLSPRIESLQYDVDIEGLEHEEGTGVFAAAIPAWSPEAKG